MFGRILSLAAALTLFVLVSSLIIVAQNLDYVTISGKVIDSNGLAVVGATVIVTSAETGEARNVVTDDEGRYRFLQLKPGTYKIKASATGFGVQETPGIPTISAQNVLEDFKLAPASVTAEQTVTVSGDDSPPVDTTRTIVGGTVTQQQIEELPNNTRNPLDLVFTLGGVTEEPLSARDIAEDRAVTGVNQSRAPLEAGIFGLSGGAAYSNNLTVDGFDNNDDRLAQDRFQLPYDSVGEVQVITNQFSAEYGRASGGRVNQRTRSGSKKFRGRAYIFYRDANFNANTWNNNRRGLSRLPFQEYNPGGSLGGPIPVWFFKNRTFFFSSYEYTNLHDTALIDTVVPVDQNHFFTLPSSTGGLVRPESPVPPSGLPAANIAPYINSVATPSQSHKYLLRIDHHFGSKDNLTFSYQYGTALNARQYRVPTNALEDALQSTIKDSKAFNFIQNYTFSARLVNQARFQHSKFTPGFGSASPTDPVFLITLRDNSSGVPAADRRNGTLVAGNSTAAANGNFSSIRAEERNQYADTVTFIAGPHVLRVGGDLQTIKSRYYALNDATGTYNFDSVADYVGNRVVRFRRNFGTDSITKNTYTGIFVQDDWHAFSNVTINFGLRYERESIVRDRDNWGPRFAVAWDPFKKGKGVIRFGAGIFYNRALLRTIDDFTINQVNFDSRLIPGLPGSAAGDVSCYNTPANVNQPRCQFLFSLGVDKPVPTLEALLTSSIPGVRTAFTNAANNFDRRLDPGLHIPESYQFNVGVERQLTKYIVGEANFTINKTIGLWREFNSNTFNLPAGFADYNDYLLRGNTNTTLRFINGDPHDLVGVSTSGGVTTVNLASPNTSTAASSPIGLARAALAAQVHRRISDSLSDVEQVGSFGQTMYKGLILELRHRYARLGAGFAASFRAVYTLSSLKDDGIVNTSNSTFLTDFRGDYTRSILDRRHRFVISGSVDMPWWFAKLRISPIVRLYSGAPFNLGNGGSDRNLDDVSNDRPDFSGDISAIKYRNLGDPYDPDLTAMFSPALIGKNRGTLPRNSGSGPPQFIFDVNVSRQIKFSERYKLRPSAEFGNILNHTVYTFGNDFIDFANTSSPTFQRDFLVPQRALRNRQIRIGLRFDF